jgi:hypothetical protein
MNPQVLKGLFLTTGLVLGVLCHPTGLDAEDAVFGLLSVAVFYGMFYLAQRRGINQVVAYLVAGVVWLGLYLIFSTF